LKLADGNLPFEIMAHIGGVYNGHRVTSVLITADTGGDSMLDSTGLAWGLTGFNVGTITINGDTSYALPNTASKATGTYDVLYSQKNTYDFDYWEVSGGVTVEDSESNPTTMHVTGNGSLTAIYVLPPPNYDILIWVYKDGVRPYMGASVTIDGTEYHDGETAHLSAGDHDMTANIPLGDEFADWTQGDDNISIDDQHDPDTTLTVLGTGPDRVNLSLLTILYDIGLSSKTSSDYLCRKSHVITASAGAGTNYQVKITVHYGSGTDSGGDVYCNSKCKADFGDIRFTDDDCVTLLSYWMESKTDGDNAVFWVKVAKDLSTVNQTIYIYYGKADATTTSNGIDTFLFFDDFNDDSQDWTVLSGTWVETGGVLKETATVDSSVRMAFVDSGGLAYEYRSKFTGGSGTYPYMGIQIKYPTSPDNGYQCLAYSNGGGGVGKNIMKIYRLTGGFPTLLKSGLVSLIELNVFHRFKVTYNDVTDTIKYYYDDAEGVSVTDSTYTTGAMVKLLINGLNTLGEFDFVFVRKFVSPEPAHSTWGSEEEGSSNLGTITVEGSPHSLPTTMDKADGAYTILYTATGGHVFDRWEVTGGVTVDSLTTNPTTMHVVGAGTLTAVTKKINAVTLRSFSTLNPSGDHDKGSITIDGSISPLDPDSHPIDDLTVGDHSILFTPAIDPSSIVEQVLNGSFEQSPDFTLWTVINPNGYLSKSSEQSKFGTYSAKFAQQDGFNTYIVQYFPTPIRGGDLIAIGFWQKLGGSGGYDWGQSFFHVQFTDGRSWNTGQATGLGDHSWIYADFIDWVNGVVGDFRNSYIEYISIGFSYGSGVPMYIDGVTIQTISTYTFDHWAVSGTGISVENQYANPTTLHIITSGSSELDAYYAPHMMPSEKIINGNFEGGFTGWVTSDYVYLDTDTYHSPIQSVRFKRISDWWEGPELYRESLLQTLGTPVPVSHVSSFKFWYYCPNEDNVAKVLITYSDTTSTNIPLPAALSWTQFDILPYLVAGKTIISIEFYQITHCLQLNVDDVSLQAT
jgi:hypothetical protein